MVSGVRPFPGDTRLAVLSAIVNSDHKPFASPPPPELERIIRRCLRKDLAQRFQHMDDLKIILSDLKLENDSGALSPVAALTAVRHARRGRAWTALAAILVVAGSLTACHESEDTCVGTRRGRPKRAGRYKHLRAPSAI
jgi:hypothetical protein